MTTEFELLQALAPSGQFTAPAVRVIEVTMNRSVVSDSFMMSYRVLDVASFVQNLAVKERCGKLRRRGARTYVFVVEARVNESCTTKHLVHDVVVQVWKG